MSDHLVGALAVIAVLVIGALGAAIWESKIRQSCDRDGFFRAGLLSVKYECRKVSP